MKIKYRVLISLMLVLVLALSACTPAVDYTPADANGENNNEIEALNAQIEELNTQIEELTAENETPPTSSTSTQSLWNIGQEVMALIKEKNMVDLATYVHSTKGLNFSPYVHINIPHDQVFTAGEVAVLPGDTTEYNWGYYYGTPVESEIILNFNDYYNEFIYDEDFLNSNVVGVNAVVSYGVIIDNIFDQFPDAEYLEFYVPGSPHNEGTYWRSLKLVFEKEAGEYKLMAIIHGQWHDIYGVE